MMQYYLGTLLLVCSLGPVAGAPFAKPLVRLWKVGPIKTQTMFHFKDIFLCTI